MAATDETAALTEDLRVAVAALTAVALDAIVAGWATSWDTIAPLVATAVRDIQRATASGRPSRARLERLASVQRALTAATAAIDATATAAGTHITDAARDVVAITDAAQRAIIASQLPPRGLAVRFNRTPTGAIEAILARTQEQVTSLLRPLSAEATAAMKRALVEGVASGRNPRGAARQMLARTEGEFAGGLTRAATIARTEMLDAHRSAAAASHTANADTLRGWRWQASLSARTCPACWSLNGSEHPISEPGPQGHQCCRCSRAPLVKSWAELGFHGIPEPPDLFPDARTVFGQLPEAEQLAVMGPGRLSALRSGRINWDDLAVERDNPNWRSAVYVAPLRDLLAAAS